jgi:hypothetical protein
MLRCGTVPVSDIPPRRLFWLAIQLPGNRGIDHRNDSGHGNYELSSLRNNLVSWRTGLPDV